MMPITQYCTWEDVALRLSASGASLRVDDNSIDAKEDVLNEAAVEINTYCERLYSVQALAMSNWVKYRCRDIAVYLACIRRNNPAPQSVADRYERTIEALEKVLSGQLIIPDAAMRSAAVPVLSIQRVRQYPVSEIKTVTGLSTGQPTGYQQHNDDLTDRIDYSI